MTQSFVRKKYFLFFILSKRTQRTFRSFIKNRKERKKRPFFHKERKRTQERCVHLKRTDAQPWKRQYVRVLKKRGIFWPCITNLWSFIAGALNLLFENTCINTDINELFNFEKGTTIAFYLKIKDGILYIKRLFACLISQKT